MNAESHETKVEDRTTQKPAEKPRRIIHRVCISCNNMFEVTPENFEAKHCPACHKA